MHYTFMIQFLCIGLSKPYKSDFIQKYMDVHAALEAHSTPSAIEVAYAIARNVIRYGVGQQTDANEGLEWVVNTIINETAEVHCLMCVSL